ncbi:MAG TPA: GIY-YIG nuclease family protein [Thermoanaerobaculia bacterium]
MKNFVVYILASIHCVLYIGMTSNFEKRLWEHREKIYPESFTAQYNVTRLVRIEYYPDFGQAVAREKQLKGWRRGKKVRLIESENPCWEDLAPPAAPGPSTTLGMTRDHGAACKVAAVVTSAPTVRRLRGRSS